MSGNTDERTPDQQARRRRLHVLRNLTGEQIEIAVAIKNAGSEAEVARLFGLDKSSPGKTMRRLEHLLGDVPLVEHHGRKGTVPSRSDAATEAWHQIEIIATAIGSLIPTLGEDAPQLASARVGCFPAHAELVGTAMKEWSEGHRMPIAFADLDESIRGDLGEALRHEFKSGEFEIGILPSGEEALPGDHAHLYEWELIVVPPVNDPYDEDANQVEVCDLDGLPLVASPRGHATREAAEDLADRAGVELNVAFADGSFTKLLGLHSSGCGYLVTASDAVLSETQRSLARALVHQGEPVTGAYSIHWHTDLKRRYFGNAGDAGDLVSQFAELLVSCVDRVPSTRTHVQQSQRRHPSSRS